MQDEQEIARHEEADCSRRRAQHRKRQREDSRGARSPSRAPERIEGVMEAEPVCSVTGRCWPPHTARKSGSGHLTLPTLGRAPLRSNKGVLGRGARQPQPPRAALAVEPSQLGVAIGFPCWFRGGHPVWEFALGTRHPRKRGPVYLYLSDEAQSGEETGSRLGRAGLEPGSRSLQSPRLEPLSSIVSL